MQEGDSRRGWREAGTSRGGIWWGTAPPCLLQVRCHSDPRAEAGEGGEARGQGCQEPPPNPRPPSCLPSPALRILLQLLGLLRQLQGLLLPKRRLQ